MSKEGAPISGLYQPASKIGRLVRGLDFMARITRSRSYDNDVDPGEYDAWRRRTGWFMAEKVAGALARRVSAPVEADSKPKVLELAAGTGLISDALRDKGFKVVATDLSAEHLKYSALKHPDMDFVRVNLNDPFPFADNTFDGATIVWANRFIRDQHQFLTEMHRVLKPGGTFLWPLTPIEALYWKMNNGIRQHATARTLAKDAEAAGFRVTEKESFLKGLPAKYILGAVFRPTLLALEK